MRIHAHKNPLSCEQIHDKYSSNGICKKNKKNSTLYDPPIDKKELILHCNSKIMKIKDDLYTS